MGAFASQHQEEEEEEDYETEVGEDDDEDENEESLTSSTELVLDLSALTFNELDFISPTNDDCLLKVLEHCDWKTLAVVPQLSRRFKSLSAHPSYPKILCDERKPYYALTIVQARSAKFECDRFFDGFFLDAHKDSEDRTLVYKVLRGFNKANDTKEVRRLMNKGERFFNKAPSDYHNPEVQIPDRLFDTIRSLNKRYSYELVRIQSVVMSESFISRCIETFSDNCPESMEIRFCRFATTSERLQELFLKLKLRNLLIDWTQVDPRRFTEEFRNLRTRSEHNYSPLPSPFHKEIQLPIRSHSDCMVVVLIIAIMYMFTEQFSLSLLI